MTFLDDWKDVQIFRMFCLFICIFLPLGCYVIFIFINRQKKNNNAGQPTTSSINNNEGQPTTSMNKKDKNNKKKPTKDEQVRNENKISPKNEVSTKTENQQAKKSNFSNTGNELKNVSKNGKEKISNYKTKDEKVVIAAVQQDSPTSKSSTPSESKQKDNLNSVDKEKKKKKPKQQCNKKQQQQIEKELLEDVEKSIENDENSIHQSSAEKLNTSSSQLNLEVDISITKLVEIIKTEPLSNEEIQVIIEALLSKNTESDWINKNDPITVLKKQLEDKELELKNETENYERAKARISMMRDEFNVEKQKYLTYKEQANQQNAKIQQLEMRLQKFEEYKQEEIGRLQLNYSKMQKKIVEESQKRMQEEQSKTQQALNQLESEKAKQNVLSFQVIQTNNEIQQFESIKLNLEKANEELKKDNQSLKEAIGSLKNELEVSEYKYKQQLCEKDESYKSIISQVEEKAKELNSNAANTAQLQSKIDQLTNENKQLNDKNSTFNHQLNALKIEKKNLIKELNEIKQINDEDKLLDEVKVIVGNYKAAVDSQSNTKDETKKLKDRLNDEVKKTGELEKKLEKISALEKKVEKMNELEKKVEKMSELEKKVERINELEKKVEKINDLEKQASKVIELEKKVKHYEDSLIKTEKDLDKISKTADQEYKNWKSQFDQTEQAFLEISKEHEKLKKETNLVAN